MLCFPVKHRNKGQFKKYERRISCKDLGKGDSEGMLWLKKSNIINTKFVRRLCILKENCLFFYKHEENETAELIIHLSDFIISPCENIISKFFYFNVYNQFVRFTFYVETESDYVKWMETLQQTKPKNSFNDSMERTSDISLTSDNNSMSFESIENLWQESNVVIGRCKGYSESEDSDTENEKSSLSFEGDDASSSNQSKSVLHMSAAEHVNDTNRTSEELSAECMNAITRIVEIEKLLRGKRQFLEKIDKFLKSDLNSNKIQEFWIKNKEEIENS